MMNTFELTPEEQAQLNQRADDALLSEGRQVLARMHNLEDPRGEFTDVPAITIRNAGLLLRQADIELKQLTAKMEAAEQELERLSGLVTEARTNRRRAEYRLKISALQPNGGEA